MTTASPCRPIPCTPTAASARRGRWQWLKLRIEIRRQRRQLARLDDRALKDIGLSRAEAEAEARRSFWSAPDHWRR